MKKTVVLIGCLMFLLAICVMDSYHQKKERKSIEETKTIEETEQTSQKEEKIRVLIRTDAFESEYHGKIILQSEDGFLVQADSQTKEYDKGEFVEITPEYELFAQSDVLYLQAKNNQFILPELERGWNHPSYEGALEIHKTEQGLLLINELPLESYLCAVVPSEMPASYPMEALKAQAVCARTYAVKQKEEGRAAEFYADVDDSVSYQVYNNQPQDERTSQAVYMTEGVVLTENEKFIDAWYYSTSCGIDFSLDLSSDAVFAAFLTENQLRTLETKEPWYRWSTRITLEDYPGVECIFVKERNTSGRVECLQVQKNGIDEIIEGEYAVRQFLKNDDMTIILQDGSEVGNLSLLPSAFFVLRPVMENEILKGYEVLGGGYGHGNGMSQNGAKAMAEEGKDYEEILENYYGKSVCLAKIGDA